MGGDLSAPMLLTVLEEPFLQQREPSFGTLISKRSSAEDLPAAIVMHAQSLRPEQDRVPQ